MGKKKDNAAVETNIAGGEDLPEGWAATHLGRLVAPSKEKVDPSSCPNSPYLSLEHIESGTNRVVAHGKASDVMSTKAVFYSGDVLYGKLRPYLNKVAIPDFDGVCSTDILVFRPSEGVLAEYLLRFLSQPAFVQYASDHQKGNSLPRVSFGDLAKYVLPLAPLAEQHRIVAKVEALLKRVNKARERLDRVPEILKRFRQSVLAAACSGRLTADWRAKHPTVVPAMEMLVEIKSAIVSSLSKQRDRDLYESMFDEFPPDDNAEELPDTWVSCRVGHVGQIFNGTTPSRKEPKYWGAGFPWVSSGEVQNNIIRETREQITEEGFAETSRRLLPVGTVLIAMIGEGKTRGQSAILKIEATINQNIAAIDIRNGGVEPKYLWYWFQFQYLLTRREGGGTGPQALNSQSVRELPLALPPVEEQTEIIRRVDCTLATLGSSESKVAEGRKRVLATTQSVLAKAFSGELVEIEADLARREGREYEPAWLLLERVKLEQTADKGESTNGKDKKMAKRKDRSEHPALTDILAGAKSGLTPEQLLQKAGFDESNIEDFYRELRAGVGNGDIIEERPNDSDVRLVAKR